MAALPGAGTGGGHATYGVARWALVAAGALEAACLVMAQAGRYRPTKRALLYLPGQGRSNRRGDEPGGEPRHTRALFDVCLVGEPSYPGFEGLGAGSGN